MMQNKQSFSIIGQNMAPENKKTLRVLHAAYSLGVGGIETWLINLLREIKRQNRTDLQFDFYLSEPGGCYEEEARSYGANIFYAPGMSKIQKGLELFGLYHPYRPLKKVLKQGNYDVFHTHSVTCGGLQSQMAYEAGIPVRVVHCHCSRYGESDTAPKSFKEKTRYNRFFRQNIPDILHYASAITPCSSNAARFLLGEDWKKNSKCRVSFCGISLQPFYEAASNQNRVQIRTQYGLPEDALVIGHAGRMGSPVKNHFFIIDIFAELAKRDKRYYLFLAGDGGLRPKIIEYAQNKGLQNRVIIPGNCPIIPIITACFDIHILPSLFEGLPIIGMEAAAGGLYTVCSNVITKDYTETFPDRVKTVSLTAPIPDWADAVEFGIEQKIPVAEGCRLMENSPFSIANSLGQIENIYRGI